MNNEDYPDIEKINKDNNLVELVKKQTVMIQDLQAKLNQLYTELSWQSKQLEKIDENVQYIIDYR